MRKKSTEDIVLNLIVYTILIFLVFVTFYPVWHVVVASFSDGTTIAKNNGFMVWPEDITAEAYKLVFNNRLIMNSLKNSLIILGVSLPINIVMTMLCGYFMSCENMIWKKPVVGMIMFTMFFGGGMIPNFLNIKDLHLYNTLWALILPGAVTVYNSIICKTAIEAVPSSLKESAYLDGANDFQIIFKILLPLIKPTLAVLVLYYGVSHWNSWFGASIYIKDFDKLPVQNIIRSLTQQYTSELESGVSLGDQYDNYAETIKYAAIVITSAPIMCVYPFLQKYFAKGTMIGAVKG